MKTVKFILPLLSIICFNSCKNTSDNKKNIEKSSKDTIKTEPKITNLRFDDDVLSDIKKYYQDEYGKEENGKYTKFETEVNDSTCNITYRHVPENEEDSDYFLIAIYIPIKNKGLIYGDLNNDKLQDLVVIVSTEGGGSGGNGISWGDFFVFINKNNKLKLTNVTNDHELTKCENGYFWPTEIQNGYLIGNSICYDSEDPNCCPSLRFSTKTIFLKNKLVLHSQSKTNLK